IMELPGAAVRLGYPDPNGYDSLPAVPDITKYLSQSSLAFAPSAFTVTDASWRNANGQCPGSFYASSEYYVLFTLRPNEGWAFADNFDVELTMPDGSVFESIDGDFTITRNADGSVTVKSPNTNVPSTDQPSSGLTVHFSVEVYDDDHHFLPDMNGGTASYWPAHPMPGDEVIVTATPAPGYKLQYVYYDDGVRMGYDATEEMGFTVPEDYGCLEIAVCFTRDDVELPLSQHMSLLLEQPLPGGSYSGPVPGQVLNAEGRWFDVGSVYWYGGTGSGCQGQPPASFQVGAKYYAEIVLTPHANWYFMNDNSCLLLYHDPGDADPDSYAFSAGATESVDAEGRLHIVGDEIELQSVTLREVSLGIQMFQEGGDYPQGCPVGFILPANARFTVSDAIWYNDANQESGGIGLGAGFFTRDGVYFTEFTLTPVEGCSFSEDTVVTLYEGSVKYTELYSDGSLRVCTGSFSLDPEAAAQYRRVFVTNHVLNADGSVNNSAFAGYVLPNDSRPKVGDTLIFGVAAKNGYRLQWMTAARDSEQIGEDITDELSFYVADEPGDVYVNAWFALAEEPVTCLYVDLNVQLPAPGGNYSGLAPATVTPNVVNASKYTVVSARWYELQEHGVGTPSSFVPGKQYCVEIIVAPNPGWCFGDDPGAVLSFSDGTSMDSSSGTVFPYKRDDGNLVLTSDFFTMAEVAVDSVELSLALPELGDSFVLEGRPWATFYTPHVGEMYTIWKNGADQATGAKGEQTGSFQPGCVYYATIRIHADQGYYLTADTRVTLLNDLSFTTSYSTTDRSVWIDTESIEIPGPETYTLGGDYVRFYVDGTEVTEARPGTVVEIRSDIYTIPGGKYLAQVFYGDTELEQTGLDNWSFAMPAENVTLTGVLADAETCVFELEDGVHELDALTAAWIFGSHVGGVCIEWDLNGDGQDDIRATYRDDGTAQVIRLGDIFGTIDSGLLPGRICRYIFRFGPQRYDVYLGSVQVNADNKSNIP
ncbi:MAG: hypothetical protein IK095_08205, partial [Oscillospiraceae bacterium]|nr:hypothetical protein [Oscillospiraceae bacterium]